VWEVLDWNEPAIGFYESLGAEVQRQWLNVRIEGEALARLAAADG
jgi:ribosomal protein S18 acetylase RimI-like enzyme